VASRRWWTTSSQRIWTTVISARFRPYLETPEKLATTKGHLCAFLEAGTGGPKDYLGRTMSDAHRGMNIGEAEYMATLDDILSVLRRHGSTNRRRKMCSLSPIRSRATSCTCREGRAGHVADPDHLGGGWQRWVATRGSLVGPPGRSG
jgi:Bacterial-like globin